MYDSKKKKVKIEENENENENGTKAQRGNEEMVSYIGFSLDRIQTLIKLSILISNEDKFMLSEWTYQGIRMQRRR